MEQLYSNVKIKTESNEPARLQITRLLPVSGDYSNLSAFVVKNITEENVTVTGRLVNMDEDVTTVLMPGWNPELFISLQNVPENTLQIGY